MPESDLLFVYGTLRSGFDNPYARLLREQSALIGEATVRGTVDRSRPYPAFRSSPDGEVRGELYRLLTPDATLAALDEYEGEEYERVLTDCGGQRVWIYRYKIWPNKIWPNRV